MKVAGCGRLIPVRRIEIVVVVVGWTSRRARSQVCEKRTSWGWAHASLCKCPFTYRYSSPSPSHIDAGRCGGRRRIGYSRLGLGLNLICVTSCPTTDKNRTKREGWRGVAERKLPLGMRERSERKEETNVGVSGMEKEEENKKQNKQSKTRNERSGV